MEVAQFDLIYTGLLPGILLNDISSQFVLEQKVNSHVREEIGCYCWFSPSLIIVLQDCQDCAGSSSGSSCSCSLVNSVVYQKMMTIAGEIVVRLLLVV